MKCGGMLQLIINEKKTKTAGDERLRMGRKVNERKKEVRRSFKKRREIIKKRKANKQTNKQTQGAEGCKRKNE